MARVLTSHRCGPGSIPRAARGPCGLSLLLVLVLAPRVFLRFSHAKFQLGLDARMPSKRVLELLGITRINKITLLASLHMKSARASTPSYSPFPNALRGQRERSGPSHHARKQYGGKICPLDNILTQHRFLHLKNLKSRFACYAIQEIMFSVRIVNSDFYITDPIPDLDVCNSNFRENTSTTSTNKVPVIRVYGATPSGQKTCLHVHGVFPYIYVPYDGTQPTDKYVKQFATSVDFAVQVALGKASSSRRHVHEIAVVKGK